MRSKGRLIILIFVGFFIFIGVVFWCAYSKGNFNNLWGSTKNIIKNEIKEPTKGVQPVSKLNTTGLPLKLQNNFSIKIFAKDLENPRDIVLDPSGVLVASLPDSGKVVAFPDVNKNDEADEKVVIASNLNKPHGVVFDCEDEYICKMYVAETDGVVVFDYDRNVKKGKNKKKIIALPSEKGHSTRSLLLKDEKLYTSIGSSCNVCQEDDFERAAILVSGKDGGDLKVYASGLRNAVFMAEDPVTQEIWATENGRDFLGDNLPPDELNIIKEGEDYGWPFCYGKKVWDEEFDKSDFSKGKCEESQPSYIDIKAHSAPLGLAFIPEKGWPKEYQNDLLVAYHGSWNRSEPTGYKVVKFEVDDKGRYSSKESDFVSGWLGSNKEVFGRPVDVLPLENGVVYISDDKKGVIYKLELN